MITDRELIHGFDTNFPNNEKIATEIEDLIKQYGEIKVIKKDTKDVTQLLYIVRRV